MKHLLPLLAITVLILSPAWAFYDPELKTFSSGLHRRRSPKLASQDGYKLPGNARPLKYEVTLTLTPNDYLVDGEVLITLDVDASKTVNKTKSLQLNGAIKWDSEIPPTFKWNDKASCNASTIGAAFFEITCPESIEGNSQTLRIKYTTNYASVDEYGMFNVYYRENYVTKNMVATQLEVDYARRLFPCFDEPEYKAPIKLTLKTNTTDYDWSHWISNTKVVSETIKDKIVTTTFAETPKMSAYLLAFVATADFKNYSNSALTADYEFEIFARPTAENYVGIALENGPKVIDYMGEFTGITYTKLGNDRMVLAAIPEMTVGAMENWGLIIFREQTIIDEGLDSTAARDKQSIIQVIAHELAHQWFGDYVTLDWWSEAWLNEGFADYFSYYLTGQISSDFNMPKQFVIKEKQVALKADSYPDALPLSNNASEVTTDEDLWAEFSDISYAKGASIVQLLHQTLGDTAFKSGLNTYLHNNNYSNPTAKVLLDTLQTVVPKGQTLDLNSLFKEWIYESGYPLLDVSINDTNQVVTIKATKFSSSLDKTGENNTAIWWIPLTYTTSEKPDFETIAFTWIYSPKISEFSLTLPNKTDSWVIFNLQSSGYYRVNYDQTLWDRIITVLNNSKTYSTIDVLNRVQLLDDIFNVAKYYQTKDYYLTAFKLAEYLQYETEYYPWYTFLTEMEYLIKTIQDDLTLSTLKGKILDLISPQLVIPKDGDKPSHIELLKRNLLLTWACKLGYENCTKWAQEKFEIFMNSNSIDVNYRDVILCTGMALTNSSKNDFNYILGIVEYSVLPFKQADLIKALTCVNNEELVKELLLSTVGYNPHMTKFSRMYNDKIISSLITEGFEKIQFALDFVLTYDNDIEQYWEQLEVPGTLFKRIASKIYNEKHIDLINAYITTNEPYAEYKEKVKAAKEAVEIGNANIEYRNQYSDILTSVIVYNGDQLPTTVAPTTPASSNKITCNILLATILALSLKYILC